MPDFLDRLEVGESSEIVRRADNCAINHTFTFMANLESRLEVLRDNLNCSISLCIMAYLTGEMLHSRLYIHPQISTCQTVYTEKSQGNIKVGY